MSTKGKVFKMIIIVFIFILSMCVVSHAQEIVIGTVIAKNVELYQNPKITSEIVTKLSLGEKVFIDKCQGLWYRVSTSEGLWGWIHSECVLMDDKTKNFIQYGVVNTGTVNIRETPDIDAQILGKLGFSSKIIIIEQKEDWSRIAIGDEVIGWVPSEKILMIPNVLKGKVTTEIGEIKRNPAKEGKVIYKLEKDHIVSIKDYASEWFLVKINDEETGWIHNQQIQVVHKDFIQPVQSQNTKKLNDSSLSYQEIIAKATLLGKDYTATSYDLSIASCGKAVGEKYRGFTSTGINLNGKTWEEAMLVAVDPDVIPLGSKILVIFEESDWRSKYNGIYLAGDTGGGVKAKTIDLYLGDIGNEQMEEVKKFGRAYNVKVYLIE